VTDQRTQVAELVADYRRSRDQLAAMHQTLAAISESAASHDGLVTATVGAHGRLVDLAVADAAYQRYRPSELARVVVATAEAAAARATEAASRTVGSLLGSQTDPAALLAGTADLTPEEIAPPAVRPPSADAEESFEDRSWLETCEGRRTQE